MSDNKKYLGGPHLITNYTELARTLFPIQAMPQGANHIWVEKSGEQEMATGCDLYGFVDKEIEALRSFQSAIESTENWHGKVLSAGEWKVLFAAYSSGHGILNDEPHYFNPNKCSWEPIKPVEKPKPAWAMTDNFALKLEHPGLVGRVFKAGKPTCNSCYYLDNHKCEHPELLGSDKNRPLPPKEEQKVRPDWCPFNKAEGSEALRDKFSWSVCLATGSGEPIASGIVADIKEAISKVEEVFWPAK